MTSALRARAVVRAEAGGGVTRLTTLRSDPPVTLRATGQGQLHLAASAAGPLGGDEVDLDVEVGPGAVLEVRTVAATVVLPGPHPGRPSVLRQHVSVGPGAEVWWLPQPTVAAAGSDHRTLSRLDLAATSQLVWREELVLGRHGEEGGSVLQRLEIDRDGRPLLRTEHAVGPRWAGSLGPAGTAGHRAVGLLVVVGPAAARLRPPTAGDAARAALSDLGGGAVVLSVVGGGARQVAALLDTALADCTSGQDPAALRPENDREAS